MKMEGRHELCSFTVGDLFLGIQVTKVQEVIQFQEMTPVPLAQKMVTGLINLRGQIVTAIDLRLCFGYEPFGEDERPMNIIIHDEGHLVSLLVDNIGDVFEVDESAFEETPGTLDNEYQDIIVGAYKMPEHLMLVLCPEKTVELAGYGKLAKASGE